MAKKKEDAAAEPWKSDEAPATSTDKAASASPPPAAPAPVVEELSADEAAVKQELMVGEYAGKFAALGVTMSSVLADAPEDADEIAEYLESAYQAALPKAVEIVENAPLAVANLVSKGVPMAEAKKRCGVK